MTSLFLDDFSTKNCDCNTLSPYKTQATGSSMVSTIYVYRVTMREVVEYGPT